MKSVFADFIERPFGATRADNADLFSRGPLSMPILAVKSLLVRVSLWLTFFVCFTILFLPPLADAEGREIPFIPGEKLTFQVRWAFIPAGEGTLEIHPMTEVNGSPSYRFSFTARTYEMVDMFYKVRDRIDAYTDHAMTRSLLYTKNQDGKRHRRVTVNFDWEKNEARYTDIGEERDPIPILPGSFDPLSVFYAFRLFELHEGLVLQLPVTDGKKNVIGTATVIRRETVTVRGTSYDTFLVEPDLEHLGGVFEKKRDSKLKIWVTADGTSTPVRIESEVIVGSFVAELVSREPAP
jgi:hypothetical protein